MSTTRTSSSNNHNPTNGGNLSATHFRGILDQETHKLKSLCTEWEAILETDKAKDPEVLSEENGGAIRAAIGQAHLLVDKRFKQFSGLIKNCEDNSTPKDDLQGFWEMMYFQVENIYARFKQLEDLKPVLLS